jgi:UDP-N-acetyl-D-glucosamine dehydrogenase
MPFYPGPGLGGHCIPVDPLYLTWTARRFKFPMRLIELADEINRSMPKHFVSKIKDALNKQGKSIKNATILILGITYKKDTNDVRESPALKIMSLLNEEGGEVRYNDPYVNKAKVDGISISSTELSEARLQESDCVVIAADHSCYDYKWIMEKSHILIDPRNAYIRIDQTANEVTIK